MLLSLDSAGPAGGFDHPAHGRYGRMGPGLFGSLFLHVLTVFLILLFARNVSHPQATKMPRLVPVDLVTLGNETVSPPAPQRASAPQQKASKEEAASPTPAGAKPAKQQPSDDLEAKLRALAKLRQPNDVRQPDDLGQSDSNATSEDAASGLQATYSLRDYIRTQVERRWSLDLGMLKDRNPTIMIRIVLTDTGTVTTAEIVDKARYAADANYREIALSARNAVILSSPFTLPPGRYDKVMRLTLTLDPKATLR